ncbi:hypothetical protein CEK25_004155 [Fusarium fujikuroi]|nr:hypothetical protein CEK25_004155 [Fusarium fujikuroi]
MECMVQTPGGFLFAGSLFPPTPATRTTPLSASNTPTPAATNTAGGFDIVHSPPTPVKNGSIDPIALGTGSSLAFLLDRVGTGKSNSCGL